MRWSERGETDVLLLVEAGKPAQKLSASSEYIHQGYTPSNKKP